MSGQILSRLDRALDLLVAGFAGNPGAAVNILIAGCAGLVGSEAVAYFGRQGHTIIGIDYNQRKTLLHVVVA